MNRIAFFYNSIEIGGAEILIARLAEIYSNKGYDVIIADGENEIIHDLCSDLKVKKTRVIKGEECFIDCDLLICFASNIIDFDDYFNVSDDTKIIFWNIHPYNTIYIPSLFSDFFLKNISKLKVFNKFFFYDDYKLRKEMIINSFRRKSFYIMDGVNKKIISSFYNVKNIDTYFPIPYSKETIKKRIEYKDKKDNLNIFWFGRLCDFKANGLFVLIRQNRGKNNNIYVIGDGKYKDKIKEEAKKNKVNIYFLGVMKNRDALQIISEKADLVVAMGTAALECASLGLPVILSPVSYSKIKKGNVFCWLYTSKNYTLGYFVDQMTANNFINWIQIEKSIKEIGLNKLAVQCENYVYLNHDIEQLFTLINRAILDCEFTFSAYREVKNKKYTGMLQYFRKMKYIKK